MQPRRRDDSTPVPAQVRSLYAAAVVGLAAFLLLALLFPAPIDWYAARVVVEQIAASGDDQLSLPLVSESEVRAAAKAVLKPADAWREGAEPAFRCELTRLTPLKLQIAMEVRNRTAAQAQELCQRVSEKLLELAEREFIPGLDALRAQRSDVQERLALARESKRAAEEALATLEREHTAQVTAALAKDLDTPRIKSAENDQRTVGVQRLQEEIVRLELQRKQLLETKTENHPQVQSLTEHLADLQQRLQALPSPMKAANRTSPAAEIARLQHDYHVRGDQLRATLTQSLEREEQLLSDAARLEVTPAPIALHAHCAEPATLVQREGGQPSLLRLAVFLALSLVASVASYVLLERRRVAECFTSPQQIEAQLGLPVVALGDEAHLPPAPFPWRRAVVAAELALVLLVATTIALLATSPPVDRSVAADPFGCVAESLDRTLRR
jgi:hypothetical protein